MVYSIGLNHFRRIINHYGRDCSDYILEQVSNCLISMINKTGDLYRLSGDEFNFIFRKDNKKVQDVVTFAIFR